MAQLPPKAPPNITHNYWPSFNIPHHKVSSSTPNFINSTTNGGGGTGTSGGGGGGCEGGGGGTTTTTATMSNNSNNNGANNNNQACWVDEFLDFSSVRRGAHRRSISDSIAFIDPSTMLMEEECRNSNGNNAGAVNMHQSTNCFDRLDDEQLMSMFTDDVSVSLPPTTASSSNPSTPSDQNSNNDDQKTMPLDPQQQPKNEPGEVESSCKSEQQNTNATQPTVPVNSNGDSFNIDPKRVKRILANRQSAQRSRVRKLQYISELERSVTTLQTEVSALSPRVAFLDHQRLILGVDNSALKQRIAALAQDKIFKDAHQEALKKEIERLRQIYHHQQQQQNQLNNNNNNSTELGAAGAPVQQQAMNIDNLGCATAAADNHDHHHQLLT